MKTEKETLEVLNEFYKDCLAFWIKSGKSDEEAKALAIKDIQNIKNDPLVPKGLPLNEKAKQAFIAEV